jgi:hypothetical protein
MGTFTNRHLSSDEFYTPRYAVKPLLPYLPRKKRIWECAWGTGKLAGHLSKAGLHVVGGPDVRYYAHIKFAFDLMVTNPPYSDIDSWLRHAFGIGKPFAFLLPVEALAGKYRLGLYRHFGISLLMLPRTITFQHPTGRKVSFFCAWFCWRLRLPSALVFA